MVKKDDKKKQEAAKKRPVKADLGAEKGYQRRKEMITNTLNSMSGGKTPTILTRGRTRV
jgi:hypothetical protein